MVFTGAKHKGYGLVNVGGKMRGAHRVWWLAHGRAIPDGMQLDHLCRNRACVRLDHLEPVTRKENLLRGIGFVAQQARRTNCPRGHEYDVVYRGHRHCLQCDRESSRERRRRARGEVL